jgi:hypothetical protein
MEFGTSVELKRMKEDAVRIKNAGPWRPDLHVLNTLQGNQTR